ncbi:hypothetical protein B9Z55_023647 [Caenorhabditis nigoni]|uniref:JmjC domain-containing protein n=1 Tax=Caenorhabditis nigoni TaxID=1611254 RepID=A0A2G5SQJ3_9PELO|nr:hypothetical protein B9Z55_023647 [Caenorhabditis nigoni]
MGNKLSLSLKWVTTTARNSIIMSVQNPAIPKEPEIAATLPAEVRGDRANSAVRSDLSSPEGGSSMEASPVNAPAEALENAAEEENEAEAEDEAEAEEAAEVENAAEAEVEAPVENLEPANQDPEAPPRPVPKVYPRIVNKHHLPFPGFEHFAEPTDKKPEIVHFIDDGTRSFWEELRSGKVVICRNANIGEFGIELPKGMSIDTIEQILKDHEVPTPTFSVPNLATDTRDTITLHKLIKAIKADGSEGYNCLQFETSKNEKLSAVVSIPLFVKGISMTLELKRRIKGCLDEIEKQKPSRKGMTMQALRAEKEYFTKILELIPTYEKFFILSMRKAFTDLHIDFGGTFVYYYLLQGSKTFWVAPYNEENLEIYKRLETLNQRVWQSDPEFLKTFERVDLTGGDLVFLPSGTLHMVYTEKESLVFGGNFLSAQNLPLHYEIVRIEEKTSKKNIRFRNFWDIQFAYLKHCYMDDVKKQHAGGVRNYAQEFREIGQNFWNELNTRRGNSNVFPTSEKSKLLDELEHFLNQQGKNWKRTIDEPCASESAAKMAKYEED